MTHSIQNPHIAIAVDTRGAELRSLAKDGGRRELLWQGNPQYWEGQSPILFPTVGNSFEQTIRHGGVPYPMPKHGLVREMEFTLTEQTDQSLTLEVESTPKTLLHYPFPFRLSVQYRLEANVLHVVFRVSNQGTEPMPFLLGAHPGFLLPDFSETDSLHGYLGFDVGNSLFSLGLKPGGFVWREGSFRVPLEQDGLLPLTNETFRCDTILDDQTHARVCTLYNKRKERVVTLRFDSPVLALWAPCSGCAPFVCIEPWWGLCDELGYRGEMARRPYANIVESGQTKEISYTIEVH